MKNNNALPALNQTDLVVAHEFKITEGKKLRVEFNMLNLFNQKTSRHRYNVLNFWRVGSAALDLSNVDLFKGYDYRAKLNNTRETPDGARSFDPRYNKDDLFNDGFRGRLGIKFTF